jgi:UDP-N-acetylmuramoyl-tripeptide--D-alanyl-D-alanine ligase
MGNLGLILRRLRRSFLWNLPLACAAMLWRRLLFRTVFIAVTGSNGKTTTKNLLAAMLSLRFPVHQTPGNDNGRRGVIRTLLGTRPWHQYAVVEVGMTGLGQGWRAARLVRPDIVVLTGIGAEHTDGFPSLADTAKEKGKLLSTVGKKGFAVLNGDDPWCRMIAREYSCRGVWFGTTSECDLWASSVESRWPGRMRLLAHCGAQAIPVQTKLIGRQWAVPLLAAMLAARECGMDLAEAAEVAAKMEPHPARMQPVELASGATLIRDEYNGSAGTTEAALKFLAEVRNQRRILVLSDITDDDRPDGERVFELGRRAAASADIVVFVGPNSHFGRGGALAGGRKDDEAYAFADLEETASWLQRNLAPGDLWLLKGRNADHLSRIYYLLNGPVACRKPVCELRRLCDECPELGAAPIRPTPGARSL